MAERGMQTRDAMLEAGIALVHHASIGDLLGFLRPAAVAAAAGRSKSTFFHHWPTMDDYVRDLMSSATVEPESYPALAEALGALEGDVDLSSGAALVGWVRILCLTAFDTLAADDRLALQFLGPVSGDPQVHEALLERYRELDDYAGDIIEEFVHTSGQRIREPFTGASIGRTINSLILGMALRARVDPERVTAILFADVVTALLPVLVFHEDSRQMPFDQFIERSMARPAKLSPYNISAPGFEIRLDGDQPPESIGAIDRLGDTIVPSLLASWREPSLQGDAGSAFADHLRQLHALALNHLSTTYACIGAEAIRRLRADTTDTHDIFALSGLLEVTTGAVRAAKPDEPDPEEFARSAITWMFRSATGLETIPRDRLIAMLVEG